VILGKSIAVATRISVAGNSLAFDSFPTGPSGTPDLSSTMLKSRYGLPEPEDPQTVGLQVLASGLYPSFMIHYRYD